MQSVDFDVLVKVRFLHVAGLLQTRNRAVHRAGVHDSTIKTGSNHGNAQLVAHVRVDDSTEDEVDIGVCGLLMIAAA